MGTPWVGSEVDAWRAEKALEHHRGPIRCSFTRGGRRYRWACSCGESSTGHGTEQLARIRWEIHAGLRDHSGRLVEKPS